MVSGVAAAGVTVSDSPTPRPAASVAPSIRKRRRVAYVRSFRSIFARSTFAISVTQGYEIGNHVLDLLGRQHRFALERRCHAGKPFDAIIRRHDGVRLEPARVHDPQPQLTF